MAFGLSLAFIVLTLLSPLVLPAPLQTLHIPYVLGALSTIACLIGIARSRILSLPDPYILTAFVIVTMASSFLNKGFTVTSERLGDLLPVVLVFFFLQVSVSGIGKMKILAAALGLVGIFIFINGFIALMTGNLASPYLEPEHGTIFRFRGLGVISDPNDTALLFTATIPLLFIRWKKSSFFSNFFLSILPSLFLVSGVFFTHSRGGLIAMSAMILFAFKSKLGPVKSSILVGCLFVGFMALNLSGGRGMTEDDGGRVALWAAALSTFKHHPLLGIGMNNFYEYTDNGMTAHNSYALCLVETGILGYFFWMFLVVASWLRLTRAMGIVKKKKAEVDEDDRSPMAARLRARPEAVLSSARRPWTAPGLSPALATASALPAANVRTQSPPMPGRFFADEPVDLEQKKEEYASAGHKVRTALVGTLTAMFFLSRTFTLVPYIMLGLASALWSLRLQYFPEQDFETSALVKRTAYVVIGSILVLQVIVKSLGLH